MGYGNDREFEKFSKKGGKKFDDERGKQHNAKSKEKWQKGKSKRGTKDKFENSAY